MFTIFSGLGVGVGVLNAQDLPDPNKTADQMFANNDLKQTEDHDPGYQTKEVLPEEHTPKKGITNGKESYTFKGLPIKVINNGDGTITFYYRGKAKNMKLDKNNQALIKTTSTQLGVGGEKIVEGKSLICITVLEDNSMIATSKNKKMNTGFAYRPRKTEYSPGHGSAQGFSHRGSALNKDRAGYFK